LIAITSKMILLSRGTTTWE